MKTKTARETTCVVCGEPGTEDRPLARVADGISFPSVPESGMYKHAGCQFDDLEEYS